MPLTPAAKRQVVEEFHEIATGAQSAVAADYTGMTVSQMTDFRSKARESGVHVQVVKNTLAKLAFTGTDLECLNESLVGPLILLLSGDDPGAPARLVKDFAKENQKPVAKAVALSGSLYGAEDLDRISKLPTLDEARAQLLGTLQAPASKLVRTLAEPAGKTVRLLAAYRDSQQEG